MPKVSVIVPIYGVEKYIVRCATSLFAQTLDDIEFIFIDDCSPDRSMDLLNKEIDKNRLRFAEMNWEIQTVRMPTNSGQAAVRRHGIQLAKGQFVIHCDSDDWVEPNMYEKLYNKAIADNLDIVICDYYKSTDLTDVPRCGFLREWIASKEICFRNLLCFNCITSVWNKLCKRHLYEKIKRFPVANMWEDYVLTSQLFYYADNFGYLNTPLYHYFTNEYSISFLQIENRQNQINENCKIVLDFIRDIANEHDYHLEEDMIKYCSRMELRPLTSDAKYRKQWRSIYPEINKRIIYNPYLGFKEKILFCLFYLGLTPLFIRTKRTVRKFFNYGYEI